MEVVVEVRFVGLYIIEVTFDDGTRRRVDLEPLLHKPVFAPLRDPAFFAKVTVDAELGTVVWPNGADLAPEYLYWGPDGPPPGYYEPEVEAEDFVTAAQEAR